MAQESNILIPQLRALDCERCGAPLALGRNGDVKCSQCSFNPFEADNADVDLRRVAKLSGETGLRDCWSSILTQCGECGASIRATIEESVVRCDFCGSSHITTTADDSPNSLPDSIARPRLTAQRAIERVTRALRSGKLRRSLGRTIRPALLRLLAKHQIQPMVRPMLLPIYAFRLRVRLRVADSASGTEGASDVLPPLVDVTGTTAPASGLWGPGGMDVRLRLPTDLKLEPWRPLPGFRVLAADVPPMSAMQSRVDEVRRITGSFLRQKMVSLGVHWKLKDIEHQVVGCSYEMIALPAYIVTVESAHLRASVLVNALNGDILGTPGRRLEKLPQLKRLDWRSWDDKDGVQLPPALSDVTEENWNTLGCTALLLLPVILVVAIALPWVLWFSPLPFFLALAMFWAGSTKR